jgi:hypothetical protein
VRVLNYAAAKLSTIKTICSLRMSHFLRFAAKTDSGEGMDESLDNQKDLNFRDPQNRLFTNS